MITYIFLISFSSTVNPMPELLIMHIDLTYWNILSLGSTKLSELPLS